MNQAQTWQGPYHRVLMYLAESAASKGSHFSPSRLLGAQDLECATVVSSSWPCHHQAEPSMACTQ